MLLPASPLTTTARARLRHAAAPLAHSLFTIYYVPATSALSNSEVAFLYCHRLGLPPPGTPRRPPLHCHPKCPNFPPHCPMPPDHHLAVHARHLYHYLACGVTGLRHKRHDALAKLIAKIAEQLVSAETSTSSHLGSSTTSGTKVDIIIRTFHRPPYTLAIDVTVSCPMLPSHVAAAAADANALFTARAKEKDRKHLPGCVQLGRAFLPVVMTTLLGIGPRSARDWLDSLFSDLYVQEVAGGGTGSDAAHRRLLFVQSLQASAVRSTDFAFR